jgi:hypothetical protein
VTNQREFYHEDNWTEVGSVFCQMYGSNGSGHRFYCFRRTPPKGLNRKRKAAIRASAGAPETPVMPSLEDGSKDAKPTPIRTKQDFKSQQTEAKPSGAGMFSARPRVGGSQASKTLKRGRDYQRENWLRNHRRKVDQANKAAASWFGRSPQVSNRRAS